MKIPTWFSSQPFTVLFSILIFLVGVYIIYSLGISRKTDGGAHGKYPLPKIVIYFGITTAMGAVSVLINYFYGGPSQVQLENEQRMATDNGLKYHAWQISHPYAVPLLFFIFVIVIYVIFLPRVFRKMNEGGQGKNLLRIWLIVFCVATTMAIGALVISCFRG